MWISSLLLGIYFTCLLAFSIFRHPLSCCLFLLVGVLRLCGVVYNIIGFSWYLALFCVVYVGGVYILFIFVSVCRPKVGLVMRVRLIPLRVFFFLVSLVISLRDVWFELGFEERSYYMRGLGRIRGYLFLCVIMLLSLGWIRWISRFKDSFYR